MILKLMILLFLALPVLYEVLDDAEGDLNKKKDVIWRVLLMVVMSVLVHLTGLANFFVAFNMTAAIFFMFFDYIIAYTLYKNGVINDSRWFRVLAKKGFVDNLPFWVKIGPWGRFGIRLAYFTLSLVIYFI